MPPDAQKWLDCAREDLQMAELAMRNCLFNQACFHAQQAAEKTLKALIIAANVLPPKTHKLGDLLSVLSVAVPDDLHRKLLLLDRYYIPTRYPDALPGSLAAGMPNQVDAQEAVSSARELDEWVKNLRADKDNPRRVGRSTHPSSISALLNEKVKFKPLT